ncbi:MAG: hypothetical protein ACE5SW_08825 [Nitrososphaeraceae archaeon]
MLSTITTNFYKKRFENVEGQKYKEELNFFKKELMEKLQDLVRKQNQCIDLFNQFNSNNSCKSDTKDT